MLFSGTNTLLDYDSKDRKAYTTFNPKSAHSGQMKLLVSDIMFFTLFYRGGPATVVYAGAAPGINIMVIARKFPEISFELYDTNFIYVPQDLSARIRVHNSLFKDSDASSYSGRDNIYFISDIRTSIMAEAEKLPYNEVAIMKDMYTQKRWVEIMNPVESMLKFRLPFKEQTTQNMIYQNTPAMYKSNPILKPEKFRYLRGFVMIQSFPSARTTECRLIPIRGENGKYEMYDYDYVAHEEIMYVHNTRDRLLQYIHPYDPVGYVSTEILPGYLLNDYDAAYYILACGLLTTRELKRQPTREEVDATCIELLGSMQEELKSYQREKNRRYKGKEIRQIYTMIELQRQALNGIHTEDID